MKNTKIKINEFTLFLLLAYLLSGYIKNGLYIFLIVIIHELGHIIIAKIFRYKIISVTLYPFGGITKIDKLLNENFLKNILVALGGIFAQALLFFFIKDPSFISLNKEILLFNLLPIIPLDGAKILFEIINFFIPFKKSLDIYFYSSLLFVIIYFLYNYHYNLNNYFIICLFLSKTFEMYKNKKILYQKFVLERALYDLEFTFIGKTNEKVINYKKNNKYYYYKDNKVITQKEYIMGTLHQSS